MRLDKCHLIDLPRINSSRGNLTFMENNTHIPFDIKRVYYISDVPSDEQRGGHAYRELEQVIIAVAGSFDFILDDGYHTQKFTLNHSNQGLYVCPMVWRQALNFSSDSICLVLASAHHTEQDYLRNYEEFLQTSRALI